MKTLYFTLICLAAPLVLLAQRVASDHSDSLVIQSFYQDGAKNCASIALIKAAIDRYGLNNVIAYTRTGSIYNVTFKDGQKFTLSKDEIELASHKANFGIRPTLPKPQLDSALQHVYLLYACIVKYVQKVGYWECEGADTSESPAGSFRRALRITSKRSFCTDNIYRLLGLAIESDRVKEYSSAVTLLDKGTILYSDGHAVYAKRGLVDCYGEWVMPVECKGIRFKWYIVLR